MPLLLTVPLFQSVVALLSDVLYNQYMLGDNYWRLGKGLKYYGLVEWVRQSHCALFENGKMVIQSIGWRILYACELLTASILHKTILWICLY